MACLGALMAVHNRERTGQGQVVDSAIYEAVLTMMESLIPEYTETGYVRERTGAILPKVAPSSVYPTSDGEVLIGANQDTVFRRLCAAMGRPELADDPDYADHFARGDRQQALDDMIGEWSRGLTTAAILELMEKHGVPAGRIFKAPDMLADPHYAAREAIVEVKHPSYKKLFMQNIFPKLSGTPGEIRWAGPELGQHNKEVYEEMLGLAPAKIEELKAAGVI